MKYSKGVLYSIALIVILLANSIALEEFMYDFYNTYVTMYSGPWGFADIECWAYKSESNFLIYCVFIISLYIACFALGFSLLRKRSIINIIFFIFPAFVVICNYYVVEDWSIKYCRCNL